MKRWQSIALIAAGLAGAGYFYYTRSGATLGVFGDHPGASYGSTVDVPVSTGKPGRMDWRTVNRPDDGFKIDMPAEARDLQVPAYNEAGSSEPVNMLFANPDADTTFAISWEDTPPVARVNGNAPDKTLDMAREGMLSHTRTTLTSETRQRIAGYAARTISARNADGGILDARLIFTGQRLYTMMALFPSASVRREQDVMRFFNSFASSRLPGTSLPPATLP